MTFKRIFFGALAGLGLVFAQAGIAQAQDTTFPTRPVKIIVPFSPGSAPDLVARALSEPLGKKWNQAVVVENKLGAGGVIASETVAKSTPDGYTLYLATMGNLALAPTMFDTLSYDPKTAFKGVSFVAENPFAILLGKNVQANSLQELIALSKSTTKGLDYGSAGTLGPLVGDLIKQETGANISYIPYKGAQPAIIDLLGGQIDMVIADLPSLLPYHAQGKARVLVLTSESRSDLAPEIPTMSEAGFKDFDISTWYSVVVPSATPKAVIDKLNADVSEALKTPAFTKQLLTLGMVPKSSTPEFMDQLIARDMKRWGELIKKSK
ncbi:MAG TPA: tripartite tricarboxylate transporter substrate-binding protein [Eoetvoesiella sp.]